MSIIDDVIYLKQRYYKDNGFLPTKISVRPEVYDEIKKVTIDKMNLSESTNRATMFAGLQLTINKEQPSPFILSGGTPYYED